MKIQISRIQKNHPLQIDVQGHEEWLKDIYSSLDTSGKKTGETKIQGMVELRFDGDANGIFISGNVKSTPIMECGRCTQPYMFEINEHFERFYFINPQSKTFKVDLEPEDFDEFTIRGDEFDIEELLNEIVQLALPVSGSPEVVVKETHGVIVDECSVCHNDVTSHCVYKQNNSEEPHPFSQLLELKKKLKS